MNRLVALCCGLLLLAACATAPKVDWNSRVGHYTYDQAILEFGPPDKSARLTDGSTIAEWYQRRRTGMSVGLGTGISRGPVGVGVGVPITGARGYRVLRLTFNPDGTLRSWART